MLLAIVFTTLVLFSLIARLIVSYLIAKRRSNIVFNTSILFSIIKIILPILPEDRGSPGCMIVEACSLINTYQSLYARINNLFIHM